MGCAGPGLDDAKPWCGYVQRKWMPQVIVGGALCSRAGCLVWPIIHASSFTFLLTLSMGHSRTNQAKDSPPKTCLMIPDRGHRVTIFNHFLFTFSDPQQMVEDTIRALHQPWNLALCTHSLLPFLEELASKSIFHWEDLHKSEVCI